MCGCGGDNKKIFIVIIFHVSKYLILPNIIPLTAIIFNAVGWHSIPLSGIELIEEKDDNGVLSSTIYPPSGIDHTLNVASVEHVYKIFF